VETCGKTWKVEWKTNGETKFSTYNIMQTFKHKEHKMT